MRYQFYSYSLVETKQATLNLYDRKKTKPELVKEILIDKISGESFPYRGSTLGFLINESTDRYLIGTFGKKSQSTFVHSPQERFLEETKEDWKRCDLFISLNPKFQYIAFEYKSYIFQSPLNQLQALAEQMNILLLEQSYEIVFRPVLNEDVFWDVVDEYQGTIQKIGFDYVAPNFLDTNTSIHKGLKEAKEKLGITNLSLVFENKEGNLVIPTDDKQFNENVEEATKGGGKITVRAKGKTVYSSEKNENIKTTDIDIAVDLEMGDSAMIERALDKVFSCLG